MAEVARKEPPVLIENVSVIINVFNIGNHGELDGLSAPGQRIDSAGNLFTNGIVEGFHVPSKEGSGTKDGDSNEQLPLGWIACSNGDLIPFGVQSTAAEIPTFGDRKQWKEIRVCLPPSLLADNETDLHCPVTSCREKLPKNRSMDSHVLKHLGLTNNRGGSKIGEKNDDGRLPCPLLYFCQDKNCQYYVETAEKWFKAYKNVKQHYQKVHKPKPFECDMCQKTFSTLKLAETHKLMCGEKYSCSSCDASYTSLEALQTHCRRKTHAYDHSKYKDKRNSVKQEIQSLKITNPSPPVNPTSCTRKSKTRKLPVILPKVSNSSSEVFSTIQSLCQQAGVKVDYGCQTVCTAIVQKSSPVEAVVTPSTPSFTQKKRKSTDTQTNIVKFRATCLDQKHNGTNTNVDWKKVITSDSQTQTADSNDAVDMSPLTFADSSSPFSFSDELATIKISEIALKSEPDETCLNPVQDTPPVFSNPEEGEEREVVENLEIKNDVSDDACSNSNRATSPTIEVNAGPSLYEQFISFLEATDSATQTDPDIFENLGGDLLGINVNLDEYSGNEKNAYVSVSSTASQTAVESVAAKSLSAEDYEALLNATDDRKLVNLEAFSDYIKTSDGLYAVTTSDETASDSQDGNDLLFDWENIVEEVYRDVDSNDQEGKVVKF